MTNIQLIRERAERLGALHKPGEPVILFNCWDVITAQLTARIFEAVATSSGAMALAQGYRDGENMPVKLVIALSARIAAAAADRPVSVDLEAGYSDEPEAVADTVEQLIERGVVGINIEDGLSQGGRGLVDPAAHGRKIEAIRSRTDALKVPFFINARTDPFLMRIGDTETCLNEAIERARRYEAHGANGIFVPGLTDLPSISTLASSLALPINVMAVPDSPSIEALSEAGVARISFGGWPIRTFATAFSGMVARFATTGNYGDLEFRDQA